MFDIGLQMARMVNGEKLLTERELSALVDIPQSTLRAHRKRKTGFPFLKIGGLVFYKERSVLNYIQDQEGKA